MPPSTRARVPALDALRGIAVALVVVTHATRAYASTPLAAWLLEVPRFGWVGVDLFFVLSGYLITGILLHTRDRPDYYRAFYARRVRRIFPLYFGALAVLWFVVPWCGDVGAYLARPAIGDRWMLLTFTENIAPLRDTSGAWSVLHFWSLGVEEQFYLVWPLVVLASGARLRRVCLAIIVAAPLTRVLWLANDVPPSLVYELLFARADALAFGAFLATGGRVPRWAVVVAAITFAVAFLAATDSQYSPGIQTVGYTAIAACAAGAVQYAVDRDSWLSRATWLQSLGRIAFGVYVVHLPIIEAWRYAGWSTEAMAVRWGSLPLALGASYALAFGCSIPLAALSWRWWESRWLTTGPARAIEESRAILPPSGPDSLTPHARPP